jgi:hypothetical protein
MSVELGSGFAKPLEREPIVAQVSDDLGLDDVLRAEQVGNADAARPMDPKFRALLVFGGATAGAVVLHQVATRQAAKVRLPHVAVGVLAALIDYGI